MTLFRRALSSIFVRGVLVIALLGVLLGAMFNHRRAEEQAQADIAFGAASNTWYINELVYETARLEIALANLELADGSLEDVQLRYEILWSRVNDIPQYDISSNPSIMRPVNDYFLYLDATEDLYYPIGDPELERLVGQRQALTELSTNLRLAWIDENAAGRFTNVTSSLAAFHVGTSRTEIVIGSLVLLLFIYMNVELFVAAKSKQREIRLRKRALVASETKGNFLARMSHEIRTPMNGILGMSELLQQSDLSDDQRIYSNTITTSAQALLAIINDILDFSKVESGQLAFKAARFSVHDLVESVSALLAPNASEKDLDLFVDLPAGPDLWLVGDAGRIRQVLVNLLGNAIKFTDSGQIEIRVDYQMTDSGPDLKIAVEDSGIGIPHDKLEGIFNDFEQVENGRERQFDGTGLGLAITDRLIDGMGGRIEVRSDLGLGSTFELHLPLTQAAPPQQPDARPVATHSGRALIVDASVTSRGILQKQLEGLGLSVTQVAAVEDVQAAVATLKPSQHDIAFFADDLPGADFAGMINELRAQTGWSVPSVLLTSVKRTAPHRPEGFVAVLTKPIMRSSLFSVVHSIAKSAPNDCVATDSKAPNRAGTQAGDDRSQLAGKKILAAEDNRTNRLLLEKMLGKTGVELKVVENGQLAVDAIEHDRYDVVLMDVSMPVLDGHSATQAIRSYEEKTNRARCPIIALTAHAMEEDRAQCLAAGMDAVLTKPLSQSLLISTMTESLNRQVEAD